MVLSADETMNDITVSILIVSYNTAELTLAAIGSVIEETREVAYEIIVVDNNSTDGSADAIKSKFPEIQLINLRRNVGFAVANNIGSETAKGKYILLLNPDTVVVNGAVDRIVQRAESEGGECIYGGRTLFEDGSLNLASCWRNPTLWSLFSIAMGLNRLFPRSEVFNPDYMPSWNRTDDRSVDIVSGCFLLTKRNNWLRLEGFDKQFSMYGEEFDLCMRAQKIGIQCKVFGDATIIHYGGASEAVRADKMSRLLATKVLLFKKHWGPLRVFAAKLLLASWVVHRKTLFGFASLFRARSRASYETWSMIWNDRRIWLSGVVKLKG